MPIRTNAPLGANPSAQGITFRVWAPFAQSVAVAGEFNGWSTTAHPLVSEGTNGYWAGEVPGATVGQQYKYYIVNGTGFWRNDPYAREVASSTGLRNSVIHPFAYTWPDAGFQLPAWNELVIYEIHVGTFAHQGAAGGRFEDAAARLPYLRDLGVNAIEVMAAGEFTTDTSWGYNPAYIFAIEASFGGITAFKDFVAAAHQHGIAVIFDVVYNHLGPEGLDDGLWQFDGWSQNGYGGIYLYNDGRAWTRWGEKNRPDYGRGDVRWYLQENALVWLEHRHVDGLRWDATAFIRNIQGNGDPAQDLPEGWSLMQWINDEIDRAFPGKISIAEDLQDNAWLTKETGAGGAGFDAQWDARFVHPVRAALGASRDEDRDLGAVADAIGHRYNLDAFERVIYTESHDEVACNNGKARLPEVITPGDATSWYAKKRATLGAGLVFTAPGIPMIFQGQEFLEWGCWGDQTPLDWGKAATFSGIVTLYRDLIHLRRNWFNQTRGLRGQQVNVYHVNHRDKVIAFHRWDQGGPGDDVVVVLNLGVRAYASYTIGWPRAGLWKVRFNSDWNGYSSDFGNHLSYDTTARGGGADGMPYWGNVGLGPYSLIILSQDG